MSTKSTKSTESTESTEKRWRWLRGEISRLTIVYRRRAVEARQAALEYPAPSVGHAAYIALGEAYARVAGDLERVVPPLPAAPEQEERTERVRIAE